MWSSAAAAGVVANSGHRAWREGVIVVMAPEPRIVGFGLNRAQ